jgi:hypothetical protein
MSIKYEPGYDSAGKLHEISIMQGKEAEPPALCKCGRPVYKWDGKGVGICRNLANHGACTWEGAKGSEPRRVNKPYGRNDLCRCGSGKKYKKCHLGQDLVIPKAKTNGSQPV